MTYPSRVPMAPGIRCRVTRAECTGFDLHVWVAFPHIPGGFLTYETVWYGRRQIAIPTGGVLAASWPEAMRYALLGVPPTPLVELPQYRKWCGYAA